MRFNFFVLFTSCALLASVSDASNVRGNPITSHDKTANVQSVAESPQGTPLKSLLRADKTSNDEERGLATRVAALFRSKSEDDLLKPFLTKKDGSRATALDVFEHHGFTKLVKDFRKRPNASLMAKLSEKFGDKDVAMALYQLKKSGKLSDKDAKKLMDEQFLNRWLLPVEGNILDNAFKILMMTNEPKNPITMFDGEIEILESFIEWQHFMKPTKYSLLTELFSTLERGAGVEAVLSMISSHHANPEAKRLEENLYTFLLRPPREDVVKELFAYGKMEDMGVELLDSQVLNMLERFYIKSMGLQSIPDVTTKVKALRKGFGNDKKVEDLLSNAMEGRNEAIANVAKEFMKEYSNQVQKHTPP